MTPEQLCNYRLSNAKRGTHIGFLLSVIVVQSSPKCRYNPTLLEGDNVSNEAELRRYQYRDYSANEGAVGKASMILCDSYAHTCICI